MRSLQREFGVWAVLLIGLLAAGQTVALRSQAPGLTSLRAWLAAIDEHRPSTPDDPLLRIAQWPLDELEALFPDAIALLEEIKTGGKRQARRARRDFTPEERVELRQIATMQSQRDTNRLARRAALFHTDLARFSPAVIGTAVSSTRNQPGIAPRRNVLVLDDGAQRGLVIGSLHWDFAREVLDVVAPDPARDPWVRSWYQTTAGLLALDHQFAEAVPHLKKARQLFPRDATLLAHLGCLHEALAAPRLLDAMQAAAFTLPYSMSFDHADERQNLRAAADAFRQSLASANGLVEARLRLGRVTGLLGRNDEARRLLQQARNESPDPRTAYYAALFLGTEQQTAGLIEEARRSFERAAALYPLAQSPHVALGRLAWVVGDSRAALAALQESLTPRQFRSLVDDPWWEYFDGLGVSAEAALRDLIDQTERMEK
jgi:tetratricopeptide (TPR) repeat protein